ncbi:hypothetical protein JD844_000300 [Phrynosoma platyrhinos]|uniref:Uncharacterized protein n=1 Tax=Phrynosoma platyrhinos TaxID=52577 RepID=A0ABQ7SQJ9_PHRPL|nr:hypothetical protein JD844_000300 [Phrynosoma platyrhinos]
MLAGQREDTPEARKNVYDNNHSRPLQGGRASLEGQRPVSPPPPEEGEDVGMEQEEKQQEQPPEVPVPQAESSPHGEEGIQPEPPEERGAEPSVREMLQALAGQVKHLTRRVWDMEKRLDQVHMWVLHFQAARSPPPELILKWGGVS